jgi:hypothetical protein
MWRNSVSKVFVTYAINPSWSIAKLVFALIMLTIFSNTIAYAATTKGIVEWLSADADFSNVRVIELHAATNATGKFLDKDIIDGITETLRKKFTDAGIVSTDSGGNNKTAIVVKTSVLHYETGSVGGRWIGFGGGAAVCILRSNLIDAETGYLLGDLIGTHQVEVGGLFSAGAHLTVPKSSAKKIAERILELFGLEDKQNEFEDE